MSAESPVDRAAAALRAGDRAGALADLSEALERNPHDIAALMASAQIARADGDLEHARQLAARAVAADAEDASAWILRAELDHAVGDTSAALAAFQAAGRLAPDNAATLLNIGLLHYLRGEFAASAHVYARALEFDTANDEARRNTIMALAATGDIDATVTHCEAYLARRRGHTSQPDWPALPAGETHTTRFKLQHDREQLLFLLGRGELDNDYEDVIAAYGQAIADLHGVDANAQVRRSDMRGRHWELVEHTYNRAVNIPVVEPLSGPLINPDLDRAAIERRYRDSEPHVVHVDDVLTQQALTALRDFLYRATIWYDVKPNYLGAYFVEGFANRLTLGIAEALRLALPGIFGAHRLTQSWAYKYGPRLTGIPVHADAAAVNVILWIAPEHANLQPGSGGLKVYRVRAPHDWDFARFDSDQAAIRELLDRRGSEYVTVPHACNRAVIFDSSLFHESDCIRFVDEYQSRRTNVTMLYGSRAA